MVDQNDQPATSIDVVYDPNNGKWQLVEFSVKELGGRPVPSFEWYIIDNNLVDNKNFRVETFNIGSQYDFIENFVSTINFQVNNDLMETLEE